MDTVWTFDTPNFRVALEISPCVYGVDGPSREDAGSVVRFDASVVVYFGETEDDLSEVGRDTLCECEYREVREFYTAHRDRDPMNRNCSIMRAVRGENVSVCHYFPSMVREAIGQARDNLLRQRAVRIRD